MTPNSFAYIVFLVIGALIYHPLSQKAKKPFLLLLSICFYAIGGVKFLPLLALTVAFNFFAAQKLERIERKRGLLTLVLVLNLGALGLFKYLGFFGELLGCTGVQLSLPQLALPIGISFYTFVICGYMIDVYRGREAERNFLDFALFTTFFPAILSGPIERSKSLLPQFKQPRRANADDGSSRAQSRRCCSQIIWRFWSTPRTLIRRSFPVWSWRSPQWRMPCRSTATFLPTPTWRSAPHGCSALR